MSTLHIIKKIETIDENTQLVHFKDNTAPVKVISEGKCLTINSATGTLKSTSLPALVRKYHTNITEQAQEVCAGDEVIISHGEHKGKHGFVSLVQNPEGDKKYHIKKNDHEAYGHYSADQFFHKHLSEETSTVGGGAIAGAGVGPQGEPGVHRGREAALKIILDKMLRRKELN